MVLFAYACSAIIAVVPILTVLLLTSSSMRTPNVSEMLHVYVVFVPIAAAYGLVVALPVVIFSEIRLMGNWKLFAVAGMILGIILTTMLTELPYRGIDFSMAALMVGSALVGAMTYWLISWRLFPPKPERATAQ